MEQESKAPEIILLVGRLVGGGTEAHAGWLANALQQAGVPTVLYPLFPKHTITGLKQETSEMLMLGSAYRRFINKARSGHPEAVICFGRVANSLGHRLVRDLPGIRLLATCRTNRRLSKSYRETLSIANHVLVNSNWAADRVRQLPEWDSKTPVVIPNALLRPDLLALEQNEPDRNRARLQLGLKADGNVLCMLANFLRGKNQEALIRMLAAGGFHRKTQLIFVGEGPLQRSCRRLARHLGVAESVRFTGRVEGVEQIFQASDLIVSTSLRDSMPNALVEAQAAGLPVVAYDVAGVGESFLPDQSGLLVAAEDKIAFAEGVCQLVETPERYARYSKASKEQAGRRFNPDHVLAQYMSLI